MQGAQRLMYRQKPESRHGRVCVTQENQMRVTKEVPGKAGQGNIAGPMSTLWEGTTQVQALRNKAPERGEGS
jgi:hypothetical protein